LAGHLKKHTLTRVSPKDRLAGRVKFSPDGKALIYTDFKGTSAIYQYDVATKRLRQLSYEPRHQALIPQDCLVRLQHLRPSWLVSVLAYL